tara:strand:- start:942 stop:1631 length:690 start_codon:yes stop_codon:yes gene_type:complete
MKSIKTFTPSLRLVLLLLVFCACSSSSNDDISLEDALNPDGYKEPSFKPEDSWVYMESTSLPAFYGVDNNRPSFRKWVATKITGASSGVLDSDYNYLNFSFENTDKFTRFLTNALNPDGKESLDIIILNLNKPFPSIGSYPSDLLQIHYSVYKSNGELADHVRSKGIENSTFSITKWEFVKSPDPRISFYKMSGTAKLQVMYWESGTSSTTDIHTLFCTFNNVEVMFVN